MGKKKRDELDVYLLTGRGYIKIQPQNLWIAKGNAREQAQNWHDVFAGLELSQLETLTEVAKYKTRMKYACALAMAFALLAAALALNGVLS